VPGAKNSIRAFIFIRRDHGDEETCLFLDGSSAGPVAFAGLFQAFPENQNDPVLAKLIELGKTIIGRSVAGFSNQPIRHAHFRDGCLHQRGPVGVYEFHKWGVQRKCRRPRSPGRLHARPGYGKITVPRRNISFSIRRVFAGTGESNAVRVVVRRQPADRCHEGQAQRGMGVVSNAVEFNRSPGAGKSPDDQSA